MYVVNDQHISTEKFLFLLSQNILMDFIKTLLLFVHKWKLLEATVVCVPAGFLS